MKPSRTYSGTRIRLSEHQAHLIIKLINDHLDTTASGELTDTRYPLKDARAKLLPAATRHRSAHPERPTAGNAPTSDLEKWWATPAARRQPGINHVGHETGDVGHNAGMNTNLG